jgi:hypothetical protein
MILTSVSCARKLVFFTSTVVPAAQGTVKVKQDKNRNYVIKVQISDMAEVSRLQGNKTTYVVCMFSDK